MPWNPSLPAGCSLASCSPAPCLETLAAVAQQPLGVGERGQPASCHLPAKCEATETWGSLFDKVSDRTVSLCSHVTLC